MTKIAIAQIAPALLNKEKTIIKAVEAIAEAAANGASMIVFGETFISGYPAWIWRLKPGGDWTANDSLYAKMKDNAVDLSTNDLQPIMDAAIKHKMNVVCGLCEKASELSRSTIYNSVVVIDTEGRMINHHRKLMPTNPERMVWGFGDAAGLNVVDTSCGRIGSLICWENFMPLARYALYAQGVEVYIAPTYDSGDDWIQSMRHIAREGRCWVVSCGCVLQGRDFAIVDPTLAEIYPDQDEWVNAGDSVIIAPGGELIAGPLRQERGLLYADIDISKVANSRRPLDVAGHYSRPDIFELTVNQKRQTSFRSIK